MNHVVLVGYVATLPELRAASNGTPVAAFGLRVPRRPTSYAHPDKADKVDVFEIVAFDKLAESVQRSAIPGRLVEVIGLLRHRTWADNGGHEHSKINVQAGAVIYLVPKPEGAAPAKQKEEYDDDIPF